MLSIVLATVLATSVQDQLAGAEIGDATQFVSFRTDGKYYAERADHKAGKTAARGTWKLEGDTVQVKIDWCRGSACGTLGKPWSAKVAVLADRGMTLRSAPSDAPLSSGSYYCRSQGCEKRIGVELVSHRQRVDVMGALLDYLIDKNRTRDLTVVWVGSDQAVSQPVSSIEFCGREPHQAKEGADLVANDLAALPWFGKVAGPVQHGTDCLYDVRVIVGDDVALPKGK